MQQRRLGSTGLRVSRLGLGTMTWGRDTDEHEARDQLVAFSEAGGTLLDTAPAYGEGASEELLGRLIGDVVARDEVVLCSKAGLDVHDGQRRVDASRRALLDTLEDSLARLGTDHLDLWQVHAWDPATPWEETLAALDHAVASGRARYVGVSNYAGWQTALAGGWQRGFPGRAPLASTQVEYSLLNRGCERAVLPAAQTLGLGVLPWSPLGQGVLTGKYRSATPAGSRAAGQHLDSFVSPYLADDPRAVVESVARAAEGLGWTPLAVALTWVRDRPAVTAPVVGARTADQLRDALRVEELALPEEIVTALDDVSAGMA